MSQVKRQRRYDSSNRQAQARRNRDTILDTAERLFLENGYSGTTIAAIATSAGVSVETIYKSFGGKAGLVRGIYDRGLKGREAVPAYQRSDEIRESEIDPRTLMRNWGALTAEVAHLVTPIRLLLRSAAGTDLEITRLLDQFDEERLQRMKVHAEFLAKKGYLREGVTVTEAADVLWTCSSAEIYELLVMKRGWPEKRFAEFIAQFMISSLLGDPAG